MKNDLARDSYATTPKEFQQTPPAFARVAIPHHVVIPHRSPRQTRAALKQASALAHGDDVRVRLIDVRVVPYGVAIHEPAGNLKQLERRLRDLAQDSTVQASTEVIYARDWEQGFRRALSPGSVVLLAIRRPLWGTSEKRLAARLRKLGHQVVWVECD